MHCCSFVQERSADKDPSDSKRRKESPDAKEMEARVSTQVVCVNS